MFDKEELVSNLKQWFSGLTLIDDSDPPDVKTYYKMSQKAAEYLADQIINYCCLRIAGEYEGSK